MDIASHGVPDGGSHWEASKGRVTLCQLPALRLTLTGAMRSGWVPAVLLQGLWLPLPTAVKGGTMGPSRPASQKSILGRIPLARCFPWRGQPGPGGPRGGGSTPPPPPAPPHGVGAAAVTQQGPLVALAGPSPRWCREATCPLTSVPREHAAGSSSSCSLFACHQALVTGDFIVVPGNHLESSPVSEIPLLLYGKEQMKCWCFPAFALLNLKCRAELLSSDLFATA